MKDDSQVEISNGWVHFDFGPLVIQLDQIGRLTISQKWNKKYRLNIYYISGTSSSWSDFTKEEATEVVEQFYKCLKEEKSC